MPSDDQLYDQLPEDLRLALLDRARRELVDLGELGEGEAINLAQIADTAAIPYASASRRLAVALLKLRRRADELDL